MSSNEPASPDDSGHGSAQQPPAYPQHAPGHGAPPPGSPQQPPPGYGAPPPGYPQGYPQQPPPGYGAPPPGYPQYPYGTGGYPPGYGGPTPTKSWQITTGGILTIIWGALVLLGSLGLFVLAADAGSIDSPFRADAASTLNVVGFVALILSAVALAGGITLLRRSKTGWILTYVAMGFSVLGGLANIGQGAPQGIVGLAIGVFVIVIISLGPARADLNTPR